MGRETEKAMFISLLTSGELKNTHTKKRTVYETWKLENIFTQILLRKHNVDGNMNTYSKRHDHIY